MRLSPQSYLVDAPRNVAPSPYRFTATRITAQVGCRDVAIAHVSGVGPE